ncbi:helix-turn-helix domain-containing protein [Haloarculaceae archaeon H-GB2-1]|nr:helix-turn-helix domain-containing protein [Haloarculaceae archaeon H-GB1-1]MEA5406720.1 helix-turn-helix domain-containing protein [Haloarculaceae archaeon H-GB2-1]
MLIAEYTLDHPILRETLHGVDDIVVEWEKSHTKLDGSMYMLAWIDADDYDEVEAAIAEDPTMGNPTVRTEAGGRRLYRLEYDEYRRETTLHPVLVETGGVLLEAVGTNDGWRYRGQFPDREAFQQLHRFCHGHGIDITIDGIYEQADWLADDDSELTRPQRALLAEAVESGYLDIPRDCTLDDVGERLGISRNAASERFRRGVKNLVTQVVDTDADVDVDADG